MRLLVTSQGSKLTILQCPRAPVKRHASSFNTRLVDEAMCLRTIRLHRQITSQGFRLPALAPMKNCRVQKISLKYNRSQLPRPFQSRARRNIHNPKDPWNILGSAVWTIR
ncbi:hypothetical protein PoB_007639200 [Plakobranchus ocellatus]|uniref:Uncharacterized protein n=1 Tax=Plakobranchus ocellatus TaxID=259542 RepID=A0AAV4DZY2_9GAST|nr:hypothetical protein PoB_007639200 [Plakobranchus ocellatus]